MATVFKPGSIFLNPWRVEEDGIYVRSVCIPFNEIASVEFLGNLDNPHVTEIKGAIMVKRKNGFSFKLQYCKQQAKEGSEMARFLINKIGVDPSTIKIEYRMKCRVCGKVWCFTNFDLAKNRANQINATNSELFSYANKGAGNTFRGYMDKAEADRAASKLVDYSKCSECGSRDCEDLTNYPPEVPEELRRPKF